MKGYIIVLISAFPIFKRQNQFLSELDIKKTLQKLNCLLEMQDKSDFYRFFWIGFIELLLKLHSHYVYYHDSDNYNKRIAKIRKKIVRLSRNYWLNYEIFSLNEVFH